MSDPADHPDRNRRKLYGRRQGPQLHSQEQALCFGIPFDGRSRTAPIYPLTALVLASAGIPRKDADLPYDTFFKKPIRFEVLLAEINHLIARRQAR